MEIRFTQPEDAKLWDEYVLRQPHASPYHLYAWRYSVEQAYGQKGHYLMALDDDSNIVGVLPMIHIRRPILGSNLCALPYCDRGEALADNTDIRDMLIDKATDLIVQLGARQLEHRGTISAEQDNATDDQERRQKVRMLLELPDNSATLLAGFKAKLRSQIKKAGKNGLTVEINSPADLLDDFYEVFAINMRDLGSPTHSRKWFDNIIRYYDDRCVMSIVRYRDTPIGAGLVLLTDDTATIPWASTLRKYNRLAPNMLLYWSLLEFVCDNGYKFFDFGRSTVGEGTYKFKKQWGAKPVKLDWQNIDARNRCIDNITKMPADSGFTSKLKFRQAAEYIWRKLPLWLTVHIGSTVRKYISL